MAAGGQLPAPVRPGVASLPGRAGHRVHRLAGRHRPRRRRRPSGSSPPASPTSSPASTTRGSAHGSTSPPATPTTRCRTASPHPSTCPARPDRWGGSSGAVGRVEPGRPHVLLEAGAVPGDRDQRGVDRLLLDEPVPLRRAVAPGGLAARGARRPHGRVLALAHAALRRRDLLGRRAAAQRQSPAAPTARSPGLGARAPRGRRRASPTATPDDDVAVLYDSDSKFALATRAARPATGRARDPDSYLHIVAAFYRGIFDAKRQQRLVQPRAVPRTTSGDPDRALPRARRPRPVHRRRTTTSTASRPTPRRAATWWSASAPATATSRAGPAPSGRRPVSRRRPGRWYEETASLARAGCRSRGC